MLTRRSVLKSATLAAAAGALARHKAFASPGTAPVPGAERLSQLPYRAVQLLPGSAQAQFAENHQFFLALGSDEMLKPFRERVGAAAPGEDLGGWYSNSPIFDTHGSFEGFVPGHAFGQWLSALSRDYAATGDLATQRKVRELVAGLAPTLQSRFYAGIFLPAYVVDKICCGLHDALTWAEVAEAQPALEHALAAALPHLPEKALSRPEMRARPYVSEAQTWDESYTMPENLFLAFQRTGNPRYRETAVRFLEDDLLFNPLSENINVFPGEHAYSHVNALSSAMQAYLTLGSEKHLRAATNGFRMVREQSFSTGGWGPGETLLRPGTDDLARSLLTQPASFETPCGAYAHFKISRYLLRVTGDSTYGDSMERVLYNTVLGALPLRPDGLAFYYSDFTLTGQKTYARDRWPCCSGTLPQIAADYGISSFFRIPPLQGNGLAVNLFLPSAVRWTEQGTPVTLTQETDYPFTPSTRLTVRTPREREWTLAVRIPAWAGADTRVLVNGKAAQEEVRPGSFCSVRRSFRDGDVVEVHFSMPLRLETLALSISAPGTGASTTGPQRRELASVLRGPVVFMAVGAWPREVSRQELLAAESNRAGDRLSTKTASGPLEFLPYMHIHGESYRTYQVLRTGVADRSPG